MYTRLISTTIGLACCVFSPFSFGEANPQIDGIKQYDRFATFETLSPAGLVRADNRKKYLQFNALNREFALELEVNPKLSQGNVVWIGDEAKIEAPVVVHYKGKLKGEDDSWVRVTVRNGEMEGMIHSQAELFVVEPAKNHLEAQTGMLVYRLSDSDSGLPPGSCALENPVVSAQMSEYAPAFSERVDFQSLLAELNVTASAAVSKELTLGVILDHEFFQKHGENSANLVQTLINQIDGIYEAELGVSILIGKMAVFTTPNDPFSDATDASALLGELRQVVGSGENPVAGAGLTHLFTGKDLDGSTAGIAFLGTLCRGGVGVGLSSDFISSNRIMVLLTAHEVGHNFNAPHDNQETSVCASTPFGFIMNPFLSESLALTFSECSVGQISPALASATCLAPVVVNPAFQLSASDTVDPVTEGQNLTYELVIANTGQTTEAGLVLTGTLSPGLIFVSGDAGDGQCTSSNQGFACTLDVPPGTSMTTLVTATAATAGTQTLSADLISNSGTLASAAESTVVEVASVQTDVAVSVSASSGAKVQLPLTYTLKVQNTSAVTANDVTLVDQLSISVDFVSATTTQGSCATAGQVVTCQVGALGAGAQAQVTIEVSPTAAINVVNTAQVSSREDDANTRNNSATLTTTVAASGEDDGGNGAITGIWLLSFLLVFLLRLRRQKKRAV